uniref:Uncharacterized protein n=1 Tax=Sphaerodactylus townsendi TaxID=933632 RepID=A0ACB8FU21_9SAUR
MRQKYFCPLLFSMPTLQLPSQTNISVFMNVLIFRDSNRCHLCSWKYIKRFLCLTLDQCIRTLLQILLLYSGLPSGDKEISASQRYKNNYPGQMVCMFFVSLVTHEDVHFLRSLFIFWNS